MSRQIIRKHDGKRVEMSRFKKVKAIVGEHFDEFVIIVKGSEIISGKSRSTLEWGMSDPHWAKSVLDKISATLDE